MKNILIILAFMSGSLFGVTFNVSNTSELRTAITNAAGLTTAEDTIIILADGTYAFEGVAVTFNTSTNTGKLTIQGSNPDNVIIDGNENRVFYTNDHNKVIFENITFVNIYASTTTGGIDAFDLTLNNCKVKDSKGGSGSSTRYGVLDAYYITLNNCEMTNNTSYLTQCSKSISIEKCSITNNDYGVYSYSAYENSCQIVVKDSNISNNGYGISISSGNGSYASNLRTYNTIFSNNTTATSTGSIVAVNSLFFNNDTAIKLLSTGGAYSLVLNSVFKQNGNFNIYSSGTSTALLSVQNNYIDEFKVYSDQTYTEFKNNILDGVTLGFVDEANGNYSLLPTSDLIDKGTTNSEYIPLFDINGDSREVGETVDIGPYEYQTALTPFDEMTDEEKLVKAINPLYYDDIVALIEASKAEAVANSTAALTQADIDALSAGWHNIANPKEIMDMSIFVNAKAVWVYQSGSWQAYSPNSTLAASLVEKGVSVLTSVDANSAMWVER